MHLIDLGILDRNSHPYVHNVKCVYHDKGSTSYLVIQNCQWWNVGEHRGLINVLIEYIEYTVHLILIAFILRIVLLGCRTWAEVMCQMKYVYLKDLTIVQW